MKINNNFTTEDTETTEKKTIEKKNEERGVRSEDRNHEKFNNQSPVSVSLRLDRTPKQVGMLSYL